jgi:phosphoserine phosphatase RsbU/P
MRQIELVTEITLSQLGVEELLDQVVARVRDILEADTVAVLLTDPGSRELIPTSVTGVDESEWRGVRVPLGTGFAGRVTAEAGPVVIEDAGSEELHSSILRDAGIASVMGTPLMVEGRVIGVIHVGSTTRRRFDPDEIGLLCTVAGQVALAVEARRSHVERMAAASLQRSLIPTRLPTVAGLELAARYLPAYEGGVGGDWYDMFPLPDGRVGVVVGDVAGRGLGAAVVMGRARSALRAYALEVSDPAVVLERLDRKLRHFEAGHMITVLYCLLDLESGTVEISSAGHLLPILAGGGGSARAPVAAAVDPPLGVVAAASRRKTTITLAPGGMLALYTDGLVERRGEVLDLGVERLCGAINPDSAEETCRVAFGKLAPDGGWADDAALLVIRRRDDTDDRAPGTAAV